MFSVLLPVGLLGLLLLFSAANRDVLSKPFEQDLLVASAHTPLGIVMLGFTILIVTVFIAALLFAQANAVLESRRNARELRTQRELAGSAGVSRLTELRAFLQTELDGLNDRVAAMGQELRREMDESTISLTVSRGEIEDRREQADTLSRA